MLGGALARAMRVRGETRDARRRPPDAGARGADRATARSRALADGVAVQSPLERLLATGRLRATLAMLGPAFVAAVAYVDPGNFATNLQGGAKFGYLLLWVVLLANLMAMLIQYLSAKLGIVTDHNLPELCRERLPALDRLGDVGPGRDDGDVDRHRRVPRRGARAEPAVRGAAVHGRADHRRDRVRDPRAADAAASGGSSSRSRRCWGSSSPASCTRRCGSVRRRTSRCAACSRRSSGTGSLYLAVGIIGATVMPHVIYLHSALTKGRMPGPQRRTSAGGCCASSALDVIIALGLAGLINLAMLAVAAKLFHTPAPVGAEHDPGAHAELGRLVGGGAALAFAVALLASGASSSSVGTYAGQVVMAGFINIRIPLLRAPRGHDDSGAGGARARRQPDQRAGPQPGRAVVRDPVRADPARRCSPAAAT